ncbi:type I-E CRISPR-associated endonuclease Cas1e [Paeniglutamicibacter cryotolerans]|uniref:CRISPR-associated endonuclease Cas1 n=1 Tax=Paeniglutamicibacter cryotolerans TaxID=670079 RepID=A0A839QP04_9MICC|nr:type I-E CRISPR-associated endonuclease Cas1e [Paeniglutamicibacter cryotolerans]MBB2997490.1 CRISPR-associated protein Cas1 [Paeniglutamicibacter cryotolerans]
MAGPTPSKRPVELPALTRVSDRISFLYLERCTVHRDQNALTVTDKDSVVHVPAASIGTLLFGPGTRVTHQAMSLLADCGATAVWVGEKGVRYYAHGRSLARSSRLLEAQARLVSNRQSRVAVARLMYEMRFPGEDLEGTTMQQLRGREGARVKRVYREQSEKWKVNWERRDYRPDDFNASDDINQALTAAHTCLYGIVHTVIVSLGCSPGLGFVHSGHDKSFVYDIADLYKAEISIPLAFEVTASMPADIASSVRQAVRDAVFESRLLTRCSVDIQKLLLPDFEVEENDLSQDVVSIWDYQQGMLASGSNYSEVGETS